MTGEGTGLAPCLPVSVRLKQNHTFTFTVLSWRYYVISRWMIMVSKFALLIFCLFQFLFLVQNFPGQAIR